MKTVIKAALLIFTFLGLTACGDDEPKKANPENNILLKKQDEIEGKAVRNANKLLENQQKQMKNIDGQ